MSHSRLTCGDFGGRNAEGNPCGVPAVNGPCRLHEDQVRGIQSQIMNPGFDFMTPPFKRTKDKVCIVGFTQHRELALDLDRDEWEVWGLNELYRYMPVAAFDRWFEIHGREYLEKDDDGKKHINDLKSFSIPIYMQQAHDDIGASVRFPVEELCETLGAKYFTNCPSYMIGFAIAMGFEEIYIVGVDMATDTEYAVQRCNCEYWIGIARGRGIKCHVPEMSDLLKCAGLYGYDNEGSFLSRKLNDRLQWLHKQDNERLKLLRALESEYKGKQADWQNEVIRNEGALRELKDQRQTAKVKERVEELEKANVDLSSKLASMKAEFEQKYGKLRDERHQLVGGIQDINYILRSLLPKADSAEGGNSPTIEQRAADPRTGIKAPSADSREKAEIVV